MEDAKKILTQYWGFNEFRPLQEDIVKQVIEGKDTLVILPTGGGKSLCYQLPAIMMGGLCLVITPLIALMKDQCQSLQKKGLAAAYISAGMDKEDVEDVYIQCLHGKLNFLYISPERLRSELFIDYLQDWPVSLIAVDEAHCISQWGFDFRPAYLKIAAIRDYVKEVTFIALTASATPKVKEDIIQFLALKEPKVFFSTFFRENLSISCFNTENKIQRTIEILSKINGSSIVYCRSRKRTVELSKALNLAGLNTDYFHAGLDLNKRNEKQDAWLNNQVQTIVCTNAFGMGIDKPDVRVVIHYDLPDTPEAFYQEAGRAGRDGQKSYAVLLYQQIDLHDLQQGIELKHPSVSKIRDIYESLAFYLSMALGDGMEETYDFDLVGFVRNFELNMIEALSTIKLLEQQEILQYNDSVFHPSTVQVICSREYADSLETQQPDLDEVFKTLLRMYGGVWHYQTRINEFDMATALNVSKSYIEFNLGKLAQCGVIDYIQVNERPAIYFLQQRVPKRMLALNTNFLQELKSGYETRVAFMLNFVQSNSACKFQQLMQYFGENSQKKCGKCDFCLSSLKKKGAKEFDDLKNTILQELKERNFIDQTEFVARYDTISRQYVQEVIRFMLEEGMIRMNDVGELIK
ncbi:MAG: RecQ family ATP-dependent DNA helicase [Chitinophagaceae bacterium]|nr:RecQ family ATP-dependent DNA helicase [Chitinophagaceae bacterium]